MTIAFVFGAAMKFDRWVLALYLVTVPVLRAQQNGPHIGFVYPAGGRQGDTFEIEVGGQYLENVANVFLSGSGIQAKVIEFTRPLSGQQITELRDKIQELQKKGRDPAAMKEIMQIREKIAASVNRNANPSLSQRVTVRLTVAPDAEPGERELRLGTPLGVSNPLVFCIGRLPEFREKDPKNSPADAVTDITLPASVNGRIVPGSVGQYRLMVRQQQPYVPGDVDRYRFRAHKGQHLVVSVAARELIPYLADAVPGWFQAVAALYDADGHELAYDDDYRFHPDPVLHYDIPKDGDYLLEIRDALYRGREDFVYRVSIGELPFVTGIFPLGGRAGIRTTIELKGWNLPADRLTMDATDKGPGVYPLSVHAAEQASNPVPFLVDTLPECSEKEPNNSQKKALPVTLPIIVNGHINEPGDWDVFSFKGHAGDRIVAEVYARRLDSPLDSVLKLTDAGGRQLAFNDDYEDRGAGLETHHADSYLDATLPADGTYYVHLGDEQHKGGPEYGYRLRISAPRPDFELRIAPSAINALVGPTVPITVYGLRKDGFAGEIALALKDTPQGYTLSGGPLPGDKDRVQLTLTVPAVPPKEPVSLLLEGRATIQEKEIVHTAVPADDMMQAFAYRHLVAAKELIATATGRGPNQAALKILSGQPVRIPAGGTARVQIAMPALRMLEKVQFDLSDPPEGISVKEASLTQQGAEFVIECDAAKVKTSLKGNLIVNISGERTPPPNASAPPNARRQRVPLGTLPAIAFEVMKP
jgi:hypothetical protein